MFTGSAGIFQDIILGCSGADDALNYFINIVKSERDSEWFQFSHTSESETKYLQPALNGA